MVWWSKPTRVNLPKECNLVFKFNGAVNVSYWSAEGGLSSLVVSILQKTSVSGQFVNINSKIQMISYGFAPLSRGVGPGEERDSCPTNISE